MKDLEIRSFGELAAPVADPESRTVRGYAIVFNSPSQLLYDYNSGKRMTEYIEPSSVDLDFLNRQDIKLNYNHDDQKLLGRSRQGVGTLRYSIDEVGVKWECEMPNTALGDEVLELVRRGDLFGCSFRFGYDKFSDVRCDKGIKRTVHSFAGIYDFSVVADPAYMATSVNARDLESAADPEPVAEPEPVKEPDPVRWSAADEYELELVLQQKISQNL